MVQLGKLWVPLVQLPEASWVQALGEDLKRAPSMHQLGTRPLVKENIPLSLTAEHDMPGTSRDLPRSHHVPRGLAVLPSLGHATRRDAQRALRLLSQVLADPLGAAREASTWRKSALLARCAPGLAVLEGRASGPASWVAGSQALAVASGRTFGLVGGREGGSRGACLLPNADERGTSTSSGESCSGSPDNRSRACMDGLEIEKFDGPQVLTDRAEASTAGHHHLPDPCAGHNAPEPHTLHEDAGKRAAAASLVAGLAVVFADGVRQASAYCWELGLLLSAAWNAQTAGLERAAERAQRVADGLAVANASLRAAALEARGAASRGRAARGGLGEARRAGAGLLLARGGARRQLAGLEERQRAVDAEIAAIERHIVERLRVLGSDAHGLSLASGSLPEEATEDAEGEHTGGLTTGARIIALVSCAAVLVCRCGLLD